VDNYALPASIYENCKFNPGASSRAESGCKLPHSKLASVNFPDFVDSREKHFLWTAGACSRFCRRQLAACLALLFWKIGIILDVATVYISNTQFIRLEAPYCFIK
jgi:hypothetical protein